MPGIISRRLDLDSVLHEQKLIDELAFKKKMLMEKVGSNISTKQSTIIDSDVHNMVEQLEALVGKLAEFQGVNKSTKEWMQGNIKSIKRMDFELKNHKVLFEEHVTRMDSMINFLKK